MTEQSTPSDLAAWVLDHGVGLTPARQRQLARGYRRLEAQTDIRGRAVVMYRERARKAEAERDEWREVALQERAAALDALEQIKVRDARIKAVGRLALAADDGTEYEHNGHDPAEGEAECPGCWALGIRRALDGDA